MAFFRRNTARNSQIIPQSYRVRNIRSSALRRRISAKRDCHRITNSIAMQLREFALLTDENIHPKMLEYLRSIGHECTSAEEEGLGGADDIEILSKATAQTKVIVTQDSDFGKLVYKNRSNLYGIVFLRPGHLAPEFHMKTWQILLQQNIDFQPPFITVAEQCNGRINIRQRNKISGVL